MEISTTQAEPNSNPLARIQAGLDALAPKVPVRGLVLVASVALAYNYSLETLTRGLGLQTPLAYLVLVPLIALLLGVVNFRVHPVLRPINDRQVDWIIGLFLLVIAAFIDLILPSAYSADFWLHRVDMVGLPFFAAGMISLLYGTRRLWSMRWAVVFLLLAWPDPYVTVLSTAIGTSTDIALAAVDASLHVLPVAQPLGGGTFLVSNGQAQFSLSVGSACSGINSLVGFLIIGAAFNTIFKGNILRRVLWLAAGLMLVGALNVVRIDLIFVAGWAFGEAFAMDVLHPVAGIVVFGIGALAMLGIAGIFGLRITEPDRRAPVAATAAPAVPAAPATNAKPDNAGPVARKAPHRVRVAAPMAVGLMFAALLAVPNASFARYESLLDAFGSPTLGTIDPNGLTISGWQSGPSSTFDQANQYFGQHATWERVPFGTTNLSASGPSTVYLDVIRTDDSGSLSAYGVEACYNFHGYTTLLSGSQDVGAGVQAKVSAFRSPIAATDWAILWWEWPFSAGGQTRYERLVLLAPLDPSSSSSASTTDATFTGAESTLESMARSITSAGLKDPAQTPDPGALQ